MKGALEALIVYLGGGFGAVLRWWLSEEVQVKSKALLFPIGTLAVNITGSFILGFIMGAAVLYGVFTGEQRLFLATGFAGAFTTFSTFEYESMRLLVDAPLLGIANILISILLGLTMIYLGYTVAGYVYR